MTPQLPPMPPVKGRPISEELDSFWEGYDEKEREHKQAMRKVQVRALSAIVVIWAVAAAIAIGFLIWRSS